MDPDDDGDLLLDELLGDDKPHKPTNPPVLLHKKAQAVPPVDDKSIQTFIKLIDTLPSEKWRSRCDAFQDLVSSIPASIDNSAGVFWYQSAKHLRLLAHPISALLKDPRSSVVKRSCESMALLSSKCQGDTRYLFRDLMPAILAAHAQTVHLIRVYVQAMVLVSLPMVPCKQVMPLWIERLRKDRSKWVREACALYLCKGLESWGSIASYLSDEVWLKVGTNFCRSLRDPHPNVRSLAKQGLEFVRQSHVEIWKQVVSGVKDAKLRKSLLERAALDDAALDDFFSLNGSGNSQDDGSSLLTMETDASFSVRSIPKNVVVSHPRSGAASAAKVAAASPRSPPPSPSKRRTLTPPSGYAKKPRSRVDGVKTPPRRNLTPQPQKMAPTTTTIATSTPVKMAPPTTTVTPISLPKSFPSAPAEPVSPLTPAKVQVLPDVDKEKTPKDTTSPLVPPVQKQSRVLAESPPDEDNLTYDDSHTARLSSPAPSLSSSTSRALWPSKERALQATIIPATMTPPATTRKSSGVGGSILAAFLALVVCGMGATSWPLWGALQRIDPELVQQHVAHWISNVHEEALEWKHKVASSIQEVDREALVDIWYAQIHSLKQVTPFAELEKDLIMEPKIVPAEIVVAPQQEISTDAEEISVEEAARAQMLQPPCDAAEEGACVPLDELLEIEKEHVSAEEAPARKTFSGDEFLVSQLLQHACDASEEGACVPSDEIVEVEEEVQALPQEEMTILPLPDPFAPPVDICPTEARYSSEVTAVLRSLPLKRPHFLAAKSFRPRPLLEESVSVNERQIQSLVQERVSHRLFPPDGFCMRGNTTSLMH